MPEAVRLPLAMSEKDREILFQPAAPCPVACHKCLLCIRFDAQERRGGHEYRGAALDPIEPW